MAKPRLWTSLVLCAVGISVVQSVSTAFVLTGDSTTATIGGWGDGFCGNAAIVVPSSLEPDTFCLNAGKSGATTGTYVADGFWETSLAAAKSQIDAGKRTIVTLQFGHNDQKIASPESMGANLTVMVRELRALGAEPVLITSLTRRNFFSNGTLNDILEPWAEQTILIAQQQTTALLDLHFSSMEYCEAIGTDASHRLNLSPSDNTHLNDPGTIVFGRMAADLMLAAFPLGTLPIIPNAALSYNITHGIPSY